MKQIKIAIRSTQLSPKHTRTRIGKSRRRLNSHGIRRRPLLLGPALLTFLLLSIPAPAASAKPDRTTVTEFPCPAQLDVAISAGPFQADGHDGPRVVITARSAEGQPLPDRPIVVTLVLNIDHVEWFGVHDRHDGTYRTRVQSRVAGTGLIEATDLGCLISTSVPVQFDPH